MNLFSRFFNLLYFPYLKFKANLKLASQIKGLYHACSINDDIQSFIHTRLNNEIRTIQQLYKNYKINQ